MRRRRTGHGIDMDLPDWEFEAREVIRRYMPVAGEKITRTAKARIGHYQVPGFFKRWKTLSRKTVRRKQRYLSIRGYSGDSPLIAQDIMRQAIRHVEPGPRATIVIAPFPAHVHEQDSEVALFTIPPNRLPRREFLWPSLTNSIPKIIEELEERARRSYE